MRVKRKSKAISDLNLDLNRVALAKSLKSSWSKPNSLKRDKHFFLFMMQNNIIFNLIVYILLSIKHTNMGYKIRIQRVERGSTQSFYVNFPAAVAEAANIIKGEEMEWSIENKNTFVLQRVKPAKERILKAALKTEAKLKGKTPGKKAEK
jgi:hypothetical protein